MSDPDPAELGKLRAQLSELTTLRSTLAQSDRLVHELRVHQIELEIQNRALREAQEQLEASRERYVELFDFAQWATWCSSRTGESSRRTSPRRGCSARIGRW
jgi:hypothetical protein